MGSGDSFTADISELLLVSNMQAVYRPKYTCHYIRQMPKHNDWRTGLDFIEEILSHLTIQGCYDMDSAKVFNLPSACNKWQNTWRTHLSCFQC